MAGQVERLGFTEEVVHKHWAIKESVFLANSQFTYRIDTEMRSTGEVMGQDEDFGIAFAKTQMAAKPSLPLGEMYL